MERAVVIVLEGFAVDQIDVLIHRIAGEIQHIGSDAQEVGSCEPLGRRERTGEGAAIAAIAAVGIGPVVGRVVSSGAVPVAVGVMALPFVSDASRSGSGVRTVPRWLVTPLWVKIRRLSDQLCCED